MIVLACETSTLLGSVALVEDGRVLATEESLRQGSHSDVLHPFIHNVLEKSQKKLSDVDIFATGIGPGSFTGIRICLNTIKALAYCHNKPVFSENSLRLMAAATKSLFTAAEFKEKSIISMVNAYKNMCYVAEYKWQNSVLIELKKPEVVRVQNLSDYVQSEAYVCGDAYATYEKYFPENLKSLLLRHPEISDEPHARTLALAAHDHPKNTKAWNELLPLYLRASEAEENLKGIKYQPLN